ncbi:hypothetical protein RKD30_005450 [Streptomyces pristinaespiralis]
MTDVTQAATGVSTHVTGVAARGAGRTSFRALPTEQLTRKAVMTWGAGKWAK